MMTIVDLQSGKVITTVTIGGGVDGCAFDSKTQLLFSSNGEGTVTVVKEESPDSYKVLDNIPTQKGARTIALDEMTHKVYTDSNLDGKNNEKSFGVIILEKK
jgi:DNA-binding beta-propeller fold protein YncE